MKKKLICFSIIFITLLFASGVWAGNPFQTDDPEPVEYQHWEMFLAATYTQSPSGVGFSLPQFDLNYGALPEMHVNLVIPFNLNLPTGGTQTYGLSDTQLAAKVRFLKETPNFPQAAVYPRIVFPTGESAKGLGTGQTQFFLPLWLQKSWGPWTTYGGGGYWINPGPGNKDWVFLGWEIQREWAPGFTAGGEVVYHSSAQVDGEDHFGWNIGGALDLTEQDHVMLSVGRDMIQGDVQLTGYAAYQLTI